MGKIAKGKKYLGGNQRSAGPFSAAERAAGAGDVMMDDDLGIQPAREERMDVEGSVSQRKKAAAGKEAATPAAPIGQSPPTYDPKIGQPMSRGQRKRLARKAMVHRKRTIGAELEGKAVKLKEGSLAHLETLALNLPNPAEEKPKSKGSIKMTKNNKKRILAAETAQFQAVLSHPAFQANALATVQNHLENTIKAEKNKR
mmetsp:Transcript_33256/g.51752  ORF Transcript_33256/g.51752 Transcript_33256/m.51752 type:complete len:200 (-) Transcript_33256:393-992(-)|eukprot:CAMPEP_0184324832 /NCGR_PEP_ID=MMETSP1049-20130417/137159_1 /TAXON_ID=77928 /ORGANISM="Proteomonas sulcata, Strain CCMP704" /LENGTH=199 /DNA_ID=CAMNT_0026646701 /DNA_START=399 /DNA_END=998 /DNA_ORIENTATION=+